MKVKYNEKEKSIEIKDGLKAPYLILKILMNIEYYHCSVVIYSNTYEGKLGLLGNIYIVLGILSFGVLLYIISKKSTQVA